MSALVVDASIAVKWFIRHTDSHAAESILSSPAALHAPDFLQVEFANAIWKYLRAGHIDADQAVQALAELPRMMNFWHETPSLLDHALELARTMDHPVYDCVYLALAIRLESQVVTADRSFAKRAETGGHAGRIVLLEALAG